MLKSNIAWMKKNVPSDLKVWKGMIQDIDWSQVAAKTKLSLQRDKDRITAEFKEFAAMDTSAKIDWLMNGDRHLGYLYKKDAIAFARREWKGLKSVGYDFVGWLKIWGGMLNMVMKDPVSIMLAVFEYHWFASYLATPAVVDRSVFGRRGKLLQADFDMWVAITHWAEDLIFNMGYLEHAQVFVSIPEAGYHYIQNPKSLCHTQIDLRGIVENKTQIFQLFKEVYTRLGLYEELQPQIYKFLFAFSESGVPSDSLQGALLDAMSRLNDASVQPEPSRKKPRRKPQKHARRKKPRHKEE